MLCTLGVCVVSGADPWVCGADFQHFGVVLVVLGGFMLLSNAQLDRRSILCGDLRDLRS